MNLFTLTINGKDYEVVNTLELNGKNYIIYLDEANTFINKYEIEENEIKLLDISENELELVKDVLNI